MWPNILDIPKEQCTGLLRNLGIMCFLLFSAHYSLNFTECQAYTNIIDAYRASGPLTEEKKSSLESVARILNISSERHKAEVRRAVNDELLQTISTRFVHNANGHTPHRNDKLHVPTGCVGGTLTTPGSRRVGGLCLSSPGPRPAPASPR